MSPLTDVSPVHLLVTELGTLLGLPDLVLDESNICCLSLDDTLVNLEVKEEEDTLLFYSVVATLPETGREALLTSALAANLFWGETAGATLALAEQSAALMLQRQMPLESLDAQALAAGLEQFVNQCEHWAGRLGESGSPAQASHLNGLSLHDFA